MAPLTKQAIDSLVERGRIDVFRQADARAAAAGFENLDPPARYLIVRSLLKNDGELLRGSTGLPATTKQELSAILAGKSSLDFGTIAENIIYGLIVERDFRGFSDLRPVEGMPNVLFIGPAFYAIGETDLAMRRRRPFPHSVRTASFLRQFGIDCASFDVNLDGWDALYQVLGGDFDIISFTPANPPSDHDFKIVGKVRELCPDSLLVMGGEGAASNYDRFARGKAIVIRGFGSKPLLNVAVSYQKAKPVPEQFCSIRGLYFRKRGTITTSGCVDHYTIKYLRAVSRCVDYAQIPYERYWDFRSSHLQELPSLLRTERERLFCRDTIRIVTQSHCNNGCEFCGYTTFPDRAVDGGLRGRPKQQVLRLPPSDVVFMIERALSSHPRLKENGLVFFHDDDLLSNGFDELLECLYATFGDSGLSFFCFGRFDEVTKERLDKMRQAGFRKILYGAETLSPTLLSSMGKRLRRGASNPLNLFKDVVRDCIERDIYPVITLILFYPTADWADVEVTIEGIIQLVKAGGIPNVYPYCEARGGSRIVESHKQTGRYEVRNASIMPLDNGLKRLSERALERKPTLLAELKKRYGLHRDASPELETLGFLKAIYFEKGLATGHIDEAIDILVERDRNEIIQTLYKSLCNGGMKRHNMVAISNALRDVVPDFDRRSDSLLSQTKGRLRRKYEDVRTRLSTYDHFRSEIERFASILRTFKRKPGAITIVGHNDADGICSTAILKKALTREGFAAETVYVEMLTETAFTELRRQATPPLLFVDMSLEGCQSSSVPILRIAHTGDEPNRGELAIDPVHTGVEIQGRVCSATVAYLVGRALDSRNADLAWLALVGAYGDRNERDQDGRFVGLNMSAAADTVNTVHFEEKVGYVLRGADTRVADVEEQLRTIGITLYGNQGIGLVEEPLAQARDISSIYEEARIYRGQIYARCLRVLHSTPKPETRTMQVYEFGELLGTLSFRGMGEVLQAAIAEGKTDPCKYLVGMVDVLPIGEIDFASDASVKISMKCSEELKARIQTGQLPSVSEIYREVLAKPRGIRDIRRATIVPVKKLGCTLAAIEEFIEAYSSGRSSGLTHD